MVASVSKYGACKVRPLECGYSGGCKVVMVQYRTIACKVYAGEHSNLDFLLPHAPTSDLRNIQSWVTNLRLENVLKCSRFHGEYPTWFVIEPC